jgi:hypothetical protein
VEALARDPAAPLAEALAPEDRAAVLDAALDHLDLRFGRELVLGKAPAAARVRQALLERRSALRIASPPLEVAPPRALAPELGHGSLRLGAAGGWSSRDGALAALDLRLALHDLGDPPAGYPVLSQIEFLPTRVRLLPGEGRVELDESWFFRVLSLNDLSRFDLRPSWRVRLGAATERDAACDGCLAAQAELGAGFTAAGLLRAVDLYAGADASVEWSPRLSGISEAPVRAGIGPGAIARLRFGSAAALLADARWRWLPGAVPEQTWDLRAALRVHVARELSLALEARRVPIADEWTAGVLGYF